MTSATLLILALSGAALGQAPEPTAPPGIVAPAAPAPKADAPATAPAAKPASAPTAQPAPGTQPTAGDATKPTQITGVLVTQIDSALVQGPIAGIEEGKLLVKSEPPAKVPLDEIERIDFGVSAAAGITWIGQDGRDLVQIGGAEGGNGVQDIHVQLTGLPEGKKFKQILALCRFPKQVRVWRMDTTQSPHWKIAVERPATTPVADLYLEPPAFDSFDQQFVFTITYDDNTIVTQNVKATSHTSDKLKVGANTATAPVASTGGSTLLVHLDVQNQIRGELVSMDADELTLKTGWNSQFKIPLIKIQGLWTGTVNEADARKRYDDRLKQPAKSDTALVIARDKSLAEITGSVQGIAEKQLLFEFEGQSQKINLDRVVGLVFAAHPATQASNAPYQVAELTTGERVAGTLKSITDQTVELETSLGAAVQIPRANVQRIGFRNGKLVHLSDLEPAEVEETPYFSRRTPFRRDVNLQGKALSLKGSNYPKGLAVHSRTVLTYALDGQFESFKSLVGFDDDGGSQGRVACRVLGDGKQLFARTDLRGDSKPENVDVSVAGVKQLVLEVDFGEREDTGDRVIWANPKLLRGSSK